jgi:hypothetical protein
MNTKHTPAPRCTDCKWIHEADSVKGTSFMGVELCPRHAAAPELLEALEDVTASLAMYLFQEGGTDKLRESRTLFAARAAIAKAQG